MPEIVQYLLVRTMARIKQIIRIQRVNTWICEYNI